jgi:hypothetical protein
MKIYQIEGGLNFYEELYKSLDIEDNEENTDEDKNKCLITNLPLEEKYIELKCRHKFNYIPIYNDMVNHRKKFNNMEGTSTRLSLNEIRCPYCRTKHPNLLPYYEELGLEKVNGVNFYDPNIKNNSTHDVIISNKCEYKYLNPYFDEKNPETNTNEKFCICGNYYATKICIYNNISPVLLEPITYGDNKYYCYIHKKQMIKEYKLKEKENEKEVKKQAKAQAKADKEKAKEEMKAMKKIKKLEEVKLKILGKKTVSENIVLGPSIIENQTEGCVEILKTGLNKGKPCGCKIYLENKCKRHHLLNHKELIINN